MRMRAIPTVVVAALLTLVACQTPADLVVKTGPGTEWPCGVDGVVCKGEMCCPPNNTCCDGSTCPAGTCEFIGGPERGERRRPTLQTRARESR